MQTVSEYARQRVTCKVAEWRKLSRQYRANIDKYPRIAEYCRNAADFARDIAGQLRATGDLAATRAYFIEQANKDVPGFSLYLYAVSECERLAQDIESYRYYVSNGWDVDTRPLA